MAYNVEVAIKGLITFGIVINADMEIAVPQNLTSVTVNVDITDNMIVAIS